MTHQFKFGDRVRLKDDKEEQGFILDIYGDKEHGYFAVVIFKEHGNVDHEIDEIEPVPHPDTVRLDWLAKNDCALTERLCDEDGDLLDTSFAVIQTQEEHLEVLSAATDIRQAIDAAMQEQAAEAEE